VSDATALGCTRETQSVSRIGQVRMGTLVLQARVTVFAPQL
jgi:hypothetical protein